MHSRKWPIIVLSCVAVFLFLMPAGGFYDDPPPAVGPAATANEISWERDLRPLLEKLICVEAQKMGDLKLGNRDCCLFNFKSNCQASSPVEAEKGNVAIPAKAEAALTEAFLKKKALFAQLGSYLLMEKGMVGRLISMSEVKEMPLLPKGFYYSQWEFEGKPYKLEDAPKVKRAFVQLFFANPFILRVLMPGIHSALKTESLICRDCPGSETSPPAKEFTYQDLLPILLEKFQLVSIYKDGSVAFKPGDINALFARMPNADPDLLIAAELLAQLNTQVDDTVMEVLNECQRKNRKEISQKAAAGQKMEYIQQLLEEALTKSPQFKSSVLKWPGFVLPEANLKCLDCGN